MQARGTRAPPPSIYVYEAQAPGDQWEDNLAAVCRAKALIPILSETYFESLTCFLEWYAFATRSPEFGRYSDIPIDPERPIFPVWRFEDNTAKDVNREKKALKARALEKVQQRLSSDRNFPLEQAGRLVEAWIDDVFESQAVDLSHWALKEDFEKECPADEMEKISQSLLDALLNEDWTAEHENLLVLSLFALGMDRFHSGGWGFSMGAEFERDDDGRLLTHGRDELNQLVIRALRSTIGHKAAIEEEKSALLYWRDDTKPISLASSPVKDRKLRVVSLSSLLQARDVKDVRNHLLLCVDHLKGEVHHEPFTQRWALEPPTAKLYHQVAFFDFAARLLDAITNDDFLASQIDNDEVKKGYASATDELEKWLFDNNPLVTLNSRFFSGIATDPEGIFRERANSREIALLLVHLRMLCTLKPSAELVANNMKTFQALAAIRKVIDEVVPRLKLPDASQALLEAFVRVFPILLLSVRDLAHHAGNDDNDRSRIHAQALQSHWDDLIRCVGAVRLGAAMNAVGWAATILGFERSGRCSESEKLRHIWNFAAKARKDRQETILAAVKQVEQEIASLCRELGLKDGDAALDQLRPLFTFGAEPRRLTGTSDASLGQAVGLLLVDAASDKVLSATAGFNEIYISPFSSRLGIGLNSLERLIYELGENDKEFINALSDSIVMDCWSVDNEGKLKEEEFAERSIHVRGKLLEPETAATASYRDLLQLRIDANGASRIVLRTCSLVREDDLIGVSPAVLPDHREESRRIVLWTFMDISSWEKSGALEIIDKIEKAR